MVYKCSALKQDFYIWQLLMWHQCDQSTDIIPLRWNSGKDLPLTSVCNEESLRAIELIKQIDIVIAQNEYHLYYNELFEA